MRIPRTLSIFQIFFAYLMRQKAIFSFFCEFLEDFKFYENRNNIFESGSLKAFFRQSFRIFDFSNLASHSRYFQSVTLNFLSLTGFNEKFRVKCPFTVYYGLINAIPKTWKSSLRNTATSANSLTPRAATPPISYLKRSKTHNVST